MHILCPCGSNQAYSQCCSLYLTGKAKAPTPEALMRSRYTAFAKRKFAYLAKTMAGQAAKDFNLQQAQKNAPLIKWVKLEVLNSQEHADTGTVEFKAHYRFEGKASILHELSQFERVDGEWFYVGLKSKLSDIAYCDTNDMIKNSPFIYKTTNAKAKQF